MIAIVAPEPVFWLQSMVEACRRCEGVVVFAPWAMPQISLPLPAAVRAFARRRQPPADAHLRTLSGWPVVEGLARSWAGGRTERTLRARFAIRRTVDRLAARWLRRQRHLCAVLAPSCAAQRTFAAAARLGAATILIEDLPDLRWLHRDLDRAARAHPTCRFLHNFRASDSQVALQRCERVLARHLLVRGQLAASRLVADGICADAIAPLPEPAAPPVPGATTRPSSEPGDATSRTTNARRRRVLLAGLAAARHGTVEALAALEQLPDVELYVRAGEGLEPETLLHHPRVHRASAQHLRHLTGIDAVIAPAWCETYPPELSLAAAAAVPIVATPAAAGFADLTRLGATIPAGDPTALATALARVLTQPRRSRSPQPSPATAGDLAALLGLDRVRQAP